MQLTLTTELEAINEHLRVIGQAPVNSLDTTLPDALTAIVNLRKVSREVQSKGYWFNRNRRFKVEPDSDGYLNLPSNTLSVIPSKEDFYDHNLIQRGDKMFDMENNTFIINKTIYLDITWFLDFESLPEVARYAITLRSAKQFADGVLTSDAVHMYTEDDERDAFIELDRIHNKYRRPNMLNDSITNAVASNRRHN